MMNPRAVRLVDPILSGVVLGYRNAVLIGDILFPRVPVYVSGGQIIKFNRTDYTKYNAARAPGGDVGEIDFGFTGEAYGLMPNALAGKVPIEHLRDARKLN